MPHAADPAVASAAETLLDGAYDFIIVGSGGGSMCAALAAKRLGKRALILEKQAKVGGSTGFSGGALWIPNNPLGPQDGIVDSEQRARQYLDAAVAYQGPGTTPARRKAYLSTGPRVIEFLQGLGMKFYRAEGWSDYYDDLPGGEPRGRTLLAPLFNLKELGTWAERLAIYPPARQIPMGYDHFPKLFLMRRSLAGIRTAFRLAFTIIGAKLLGRDYVANGAAVQGRMLQISLREGIAILPDTAVQELVVENDRVVGVIAQRKGGEIALRAKDGVLLDSGGFSRNAAMRQQYARSPTGSHWTNANPGDTGEMMQAAMRLGAATDCLDTAWWCLTSAHTNGTWPEGVKTKDGVFPFLHHLDISLPYSILVDQRGARFVNEAASYMELGERMYEQHAATGKAIPAWTIFDARHRRWYPWGSKPPGVTPKVWIESGYMKKAHSLEALAELCGIDKAGLSATVERFNSFCRAGHDADFNRGGRAFDRYHGDPKVKPNPNLGAIEQAPFYAVAMYPSDVGTAGGLVTDEHARVLREDNTPIAGLYATGNCTASVMGRSYPGAGASIAASFIFGFLAIEHAASTATRASL